MKIPKIKLTSKQKRIQSQLNKKLSRLATDRKSERCNRANLALWLRKFGLDIRNSPLATINKMVKATHKIIKDERGGKDERVFGMLCEAGTTVKIVERLKAIDLESSRKLLEERKSGMTLEEMHEAYNTLTGEYHPTKEIHTLRYELRKKYLERAIAARTQLIKKKVKNPRYSSEFQSRKAKIKIARCKRIEDNVRVTGCALDDQAKELGCYDKSFTFNRPIAKGSAMTVTREIPYPELTRKERKKINNSYYKKLQAA